MKTVYFIYDFVDKDIVSRITNGATRSRGRAPWMVFLENKNNEERCGGMIINVRFILTAAHCVDGYKKNDIPRDFPKNIRGHESVLKIFTFCTLILFSAVVGHSEICGRIKRSKTFEIDKVYTHPRYGEYKQETQLIYDFALLRTSQKLSFDKYDVQPICLPPLSKNYY